MVRQVFDYKPQSLGISRTKMRLPLKILSLKPKIQIFDNLVSFPF